MVKKPKMTRSVRHECGLCRKSVWVDAGRFQKHDDANGKKCRGSEKRPGTES